MEVSSEAEREASDRRAGLLHAVATLVFAYLPLSVQAITLLALSKAWKQWADEQGAKERALEEVAKNDELEVWIHGRGWSPIGVCVPLWAAQQQRDLSDDLKRRLQLRAAARGDVDAVDWFGVGDYDLHHTRLYASAARGGQLQVLQWLRDRGCAWDSSTCAAAAGGGHLGVLQWARANGCAWDAYTCSSAAAGGHLGVLQWARANGCAWTAGTCSSAAAGGHLAVLQWARANGCDWNDFTCTAAARGGHLAVLQWARANGCAWDTRTCTEAARSGQLAVLQWARANGCPGAA
jgi:hypothetical protein